LDGRLGGSRGRSGRYGKEEYSLSLMKIGTRFLGRPAYTLVTVMTELPRFPPTSCVHEMRCLSNRDLPSSLSHEPRIEQPYPTEASLSSPCDAAATGRGDTTSCWDLTEPEGSYHPQFVPTLRQANSAHTLPRYFLRFTFMLSHHIGRHLGFSR
jgi:hypothetical protein